MLRVAEIVAREPFHRREIAFRVFRARGKARIFLRVREISGDIGRIDEQLRGEIDPASRQAIATAAARLPPALAPATPTRMLSPPNRRTRENIAHGGEADDDGACLDCEQTRLPVMRFEIAGDPTAAVEKHDVGDFSGETR
jgi:hypothetical protein